MTREEAIKVIRKMLAYTDLSVRANLTADMVDACRLAIKALEQEPILDKVKQAREEIENLNLNDYGDNLYQFQAKCTEILDKLIESEG